MTTRKPVVTMREIALRAGQSMSSPKALLWASLFAAGFSLFLGCTAAAETRMSATYQTTETTIEAPAIEATSALDMRDDEYNSDYIFGMTKGVANSTITPALKPVFFLVTIPLDIVFLPFAVIGGFF